MTKERKGGRRDREKGREGREGRDRVKAFGVDVPQATVLSLDAEEDQAVHLFSFKISDKRGEGRAQSRLINYQLGRRSRS